MNYIVNVRKKEVEELLREVKNTKNAAPDGCCIFYIKLYIPEFIFLRNKLRDII